MEKLTQLIDELVSEKTFNLDAVEGIQKLRERAEALETKSVSLEEKLEKEEGKSVKEIVKNDKLLQELSEWRSRESSLSEREKKITELEKAKAVAQAESATFEKCVGLVFRNTMLRKDAFGQVPVADNNGYTTAQSTSETTTEVKE